MTPRDESEYGERNADRYDELSLGADGGAWLDPVNAVATLATLAGDGPVLELGVGNGRLAIPLAAEGLAVTGIDSSPAMLDQLAARPGGQAVTAVLGDMADVDVEGPFALAFVAFSTFYALTTQDRQRRCLANVRRRLRPGGRFVIEAWLPELADLRSQAVTASRVEGDEVQLEARSHDPLSQRVDLQHIVVRPDGIELLPTRARYVWLSELDLLAREAGLHLEHRWAGWQGEQLGPWSFRHVSVYRSAT